MTAHTADTPASPPCWTETPSKPKLKLPNGACDAHVHVFGPRRRFPFAEGRGYTPSDAPKATLFALHEFLGIDHCVIVQPACHGHDNAVTVDALAATGGAYRGVVLVPVTITDAELKAFDAAGIRGARFHYMKHLRRNAPIDEVIVFAKRLADIGWHLQIHMEAELIGDMTAALKRSPVPVVIDHMGRVDASLGVEQPAFQAMLRLMADAKLWVKVSGADRITRQSPSMGPPYADAVPFARRLVAEFGDRCVWGTDFPHPNHTGPVPDDGQLVDLIAEFAPTEAQRQALLVDNPMRFYQFAPPMRRAATEAKP